jgi:ferritin-like protein
MRTAGMTLIKGEGVDIEEIVARLDSFYCYQMVVMHFCYAVENRLEGQALFLLRSELLEVAEESLAAARKLADRIGELGGAVTADPARFTERSPLREFALPESASDVGVILTYVCERVGAIIEAYGAFLEWVQDKDELSHRLVLELLQQQVAREADLVAALA